MDGHGNAGGVSNSGGFCDPRTLEGAHLNAECPTCAHAVIEHLVRDDPITGRPRGACLRCAGFTTAHADARSAAVPIAGISEKPVGRLDR